MEQSGSDDVTPAKKFMDFDESQKTAVLAEMSTVMDMEKILPNDLKEWDKETTSLVLEKAFSLCGLPRTTEGRSAEVVRKEQDNLKLQLDALRYKKAKNAVFLETHRQVAQDRFYLERCLEIQKMDLAISSDRMLADEFEPTQQRNQDLEQISMTRAVIAQLETDLEVLKSPLRD